MRILHYMFGVPPVRTGGSVKYVFDLIMEQQSRGEEVILLVPGSINRKKRNETHIVKMRDWKHEIEQYQIKNALPIPIANGIRDIEWYTAMGNYDEYKNFLCIKKPDIIHIHSLMGIHANFFIAANDLEIPMVFTTHDYFGICPKTELVDLEGNCDRIEWELCWKCCQNAFSNRRLMMDQSKLVSIYLASPVLVSIVNTIHNFLRFFSMPEDTNKSVDDIKELSEDLKKDYKRLKEYYRMIFKQITLFHYNSNVARTEYEKRIPFANGKVISITNAEIGDNRRIKTFGKTLKIGFMGGITRNKGYYFLQDVIQQIVQSGRTDIELHVYTREKRKFPKWVCVHDPYNHTDVGQVMESQDVVVVPSLGRETFGFTALEAISYGVPVILTEYVGAKDLLLNNEWGYQAASTQEALFEVIESIYDDRSILQEINQKICRDTFDFSMEKHVKDIKLLYMEAVERLDN